MQSNAACLTTNSEFQKGHSPNGFDGFFYRRFTPQTNASGVLIKEEEVFQSASGQTEAYMSAFAFDEEGKEHFERNGTMRGFTGPCYSEFFVLDIDREGDLKAALSDTKALVEYFQSLGLEKGLRVFFSGSKGFHIEVPTKPFNLEPSPAFPKQCRAIAEKVSKDTGIVFDPAMFETIRLYRVCSSLNPKSKLYKIPLDISEILLGFLTIEEIQQRAKSGDYHFPSIQVPEIDLSDFVSVTIPHAKASAWDLEVGYPNVSINWNQRLNNENWDTQIFQLAAACKHLGIGEEECERALNQLWRRCQSPGYDEFGEDRVRRKVRSAYDGGAHVSLRDSLVSHFFVWDRKENPPIEGNGEEKNPYEFCSIGEILAREIKDPDWVVKGLLPRNGLSIICAKPKTGKTTFMRQLALCVARGEPFLDRETKKGRACYLSLEDSELILKKHFETLGATKEDDLLIAFRSPKENPIQWLEQQIKEIKPTLIVIDVINYFISWEDGNDYNQSYKALKEILGLARSFPGHIALIHHAKKGEIRHNDTDAFLGSTAMSAVPDSLIILRKDSYEADGLRSFSTVQRYGEAIPPTLLNMDQDGWLRVAGEKSELEIISIVNQAREIIQDSSPEFVLAKDLRDRLEGKTTKIGSALKRLEQCVEVEVQGKGRSGDPKRFKWRTFENWGKRAD